MSDENTKPTNEEVEAQLLEQAEQRAQDPFETASMLHGLYIGKFKAGVRKMSSRQLRRLMIALVECPFWNQEPNFGTHEEKELFAIGDNLLIAKTIMIQQSFMEAQEKINNETKENEDNGENKASSSG